MKDTLIMNEFQFIDIIFLAAVAAFIAFKLRSTLGKDSGDVDILKPPTGRGDKSKDARVIALSEMRNGIAPEKKAAEDILLLAGIEDPEISKTLIEIKKHDPSFSVGEFLEGAKTAFEWVFGAFVKKDKQALKSLLADDIYVDFAKELERLEAEDVRPDSTLVAITSANIVAAELKGSVARLTVKFVSEQVVIMRDKDGKIVDGDPSHVDEVENEWVFERNLKSGNPNWLIVAT